MKQILSKLEETGNFEPIIFPEDTLLNLPVEDWPVVDVLISFYAIDGQTVFPLAKVQDYVKLRKPICVNEMASQWTLLDRTKVYAELAAINVPTPRHVVCRRDVQFGYSGPMSEFTETEDYVEVNGVRIDKPFVEKPVSGEDHNIYVYYPKVGDKPGGSKRLFRKVQKQQQQTTTTNNNRPQQQP